MVFVDSVINPDMLFISNHRIQFSEKQFWLSWLWQEIQRSYLCVVEFTPVKSCSTVVNLTRKWNVHRLHDATSSVDALHVGVDALHVEVDKMLCRLSRSLWIRSYAGGCRLPQAACRLYTIVCRLHAGCMQPACSLHAVCIRSYTGGCRLQQDACRMQQAACRLYAACMQPACSLHAACMHL